MSVVKNILGVKIQMLGKLNKMEINGLIKLFCLWQEIKNSTILIKLLLTGDKLMPELHLKQSGFTCSVCEPFTKLCERIWKFRETGNLKHSLEMN